jgi:hypothetical protein
MRPLSDTKQNDLDNSEYMWLKIIYISKALLLNNDKNQFEFFLVVKPGNIFFAPKFQSGPFDLNHVEISNRRHLANFCKNLKTI